MFVVRLFFLNSLNSSSAHETIKVTLLGNDEVLNYTLSNMMVLNFSVQIGYLTEGN